MARRERNFVSVWLVVTVVLSVGMTFAGASEGRAQAGCVLTISCPPDRTIECDELTDPANTGMASFTASPECGIVIVSFTDVVTPGACAQERTIARTWTATASSGETASCVQTITVQDTEGPQVSCPSNLSLTCLPAVPPCVIGGISAFDNCGGFFPVSCTRTDNGGSGCPDDPFIITDTYTATDNCGNTGQCQRTITVIDDIPPVLSACPSNQTLACARDLPACDVSITAVDNCDGGVQVTCTDGELVGGPCGGSITRTYAATDRCGNTATCVQVFTIDDNSEPVISCPPDKQLECGESTDPANTGSATATDNCGTVMISFTDALLPIDCTGQAGIDRTWVAVDDCGNRAICVQEIRFVDLTAPTIGCPPDRDLLCGESSDPSNTGSASALDNCGGAVAITHTDAATPANCTGLAGVDRTWRAEDVCGNAITCVQHIRYVDVTAPVVTTSSDITVENDSAQCGAIVTYASSALDDCGGNLPVTCDWPSGSFFPVGTTTVTCEATDACGNSGSQSFNVTVFSCPCHHDPVCDSILNILDVIGIVEVAFRGGSEHFDSCPSSREDVDCTGYVDVADVVKMVNVAFRGVALALEFCNPCP